MDTFVEDEEMTYDPEIEKLLPWYVKGLLETDDVERVEAYLADNPQMRVQLDLIAQEDKAIADQHAALGAPMPGGLDRLLADIDAIEGEKAPIYHPTNSLAQYISEFFALFVRPGIQFAAMAAAIVIVAQGVILGTLLLGDPSAPVTSNAYKTASGPAQATKQDGVTFLVAFKGDASISDLAKLLKSQGAVIVSGPKAGGFFTLFVPSAKVPEEGAKVVLKALQEQKNIVKFASISQ